MSVLSAYTKPDDEPVDPVDDILTRTGCKEVNIVLQECVSETRDWRKCQAEVKKLKECMDRYYEKCYLEREESKAEKGKTSLNPKTEK